MTRYLLIAFFAFSVPFAARAATLTIEQKNEEGKYGIWTMIRPDRVTESGSHALRTWNDLPGGRYTIFFEEPSGTVASVRLYHGKEQLSQVMRPQVNVTLADEEDLRVVVHYPFIRTGTVAIHSDPPGLSFSLKGPNGMQQEGITPVDLQPAPEGQYSVQFEVPEGCTRPPLKSDVLTKDSRISFSLILSCAAADAMRAEEKERTERFVTTTMRGEDLTFTDVPQDAWFALHVFNMAKWGIISGYRDKGGNLTGEFGPARNITLAELLKIAHEAAGIDESVFTRQPENSRARLTWFQSYYASAEDAAWTVYLDPRLDPGRNATRGEVLATLLQAFDQPVKWPKGDVFKDVTRRTPFAGVIETAAELGIIDGWEAKGTLEFRPDASINRAEIAKMIDKTVEVLRGEEE